MIFNFQKQNPQRLTLIEWLFLILWLNFTFLVNPYIHYTPTQKWISEGAFIFNFWAHSSTAVFRTPRSLVLHFIFIFCVFALKRGISKQKSTALLSRVWRRALFLVRERRKLLRALLKVHASVAVCGHGEAAGSAGGHMNRAETRLHYFYYIGTTLSHSATIIFIWVRIERVA